MELIVIASLKVKPGRRDLFDDFERQALTIAAQHGGDLLHAIRPTGNLPAGELPDEVHILRFPDERAFEAYRADPALIALAPLRAEAILSTSVLTGHTLAIKVEY
jgi:uncharacterized protein (DUF1330 family)